MGVILLVWAWPLVGKSHRWAWYGMVTNLREASGCDITCLGVASGDESHGWVCYGMVSNPREASGCDMVWHGYQSKGDQSLTTERCFDSHATST